VAEITPGMGILPSCKGGLLENRNQEVVENSGSYPNVWGEIKVIDTQNKTATAIVVKSKIDMVIGH
jgi:hypothetical protein